MDLLSVILKFILLYITFVDGLVNGQLINSETSFNSRFESLEKFIHQQDLHIKEQNKRMGYLENLVGKYHDEVSKQKQELSLQMSRIQTLEGLTENQRKDINTMKSNAHNMGAVQDDCTAKILRLENIIRQKKISQVEVPNSNAKVEERQEKKVQSNDKRDRRLLVSVTDSPPTQATVFYAYLSHHELAIGAHHVMIYDTIKTNTNSAYSKFTGVFTVPFGGLYGFTYTVRMGCHTTRALGPFELIRNSVVEAVLFLDNHSCENQETNTVTALLHADQGDKLYIRTHTTFDAFDGNVYSDLNGYSSFGGWSIQYD